MTAFILKVDCSATLIFYILHLTIVKEWQMTEVRMTKKLYHLINQTYERICYPTLYLLKQKNLKLEKRNDFKISPRKNTRLEKNYIHHLSINSPPLVRPKYWVTTHKGRCCKQNFSAKPIYLCCIKFQM